jgi:lipoate-protein ligase B
MRLRHVHLPNLTAYAHAELLQTRLSSLLLAHKASPVQPAPPATIITFECLPTYTTGRRELTSTAQSQLEYLGAPVTSGASTISAQVVQARRGGQTTFHGPGQLVAYPLMDLRSPELEREIRPKCYVDLLEAVSIATLARYGIHGMRTEHPGVWVDEQRKIAAVGVHLKRFTTSHGIGLNVNTDLGWFRRIVACGLEGKDTTTMEKELRDRGADIPTDMRVVDVGRVFVDEFAKEIGAQVEVCGEEDVFEGREREEYLKEREELAETEKRS